MIQIIPYISNQYLLLKKWKENIENIRNMLSDNRNHQFLRNKKVIGTVNMTNALETSVIAKADVGKIHEIAYESTKVV